MDHTTTCDESIYILGPHDVILGRGVPKMKHPGNIKLRGYVEDFCNIYESTDKNEKKHVAKNIVKLIQRDGGRFINDGEFGLVEASEEIAYQKVSHAFRDNRGQKTSAAMKKKKKKKGERTRRLKRERDFG